MQVYVLIAALDKGLEKRHELWAAHFKVVDSVNFSQHRLGFNHFLNLPLVFYIFLQFKPKFLQHS